LHREQRHNALRNAMRSGTPLAQAWQEL